MRTLRVCSALGMSVLALAPIQGSAQFTQWDLATEVVMHAEALDEGFVDSFLPSQLGDTLLYDYSLDWAAGTFMYATRANQQLAGVPFSMGANGAYDPLQQKWTWTTRTNFGTQIILGGGTFRWISTDETKDAEIEGVWSDDEMNPIGTAKGTATITQQTHSVTSTGTFEVKDKDGKSKGTKKLSDTKVQTEPDPLKPQKYVWYMFEVQESKPTAWISTGSEIGTAASQSTGRFFQTVAVPEPATIGIVGLGLLSLARRRRR